MLHFQTVCDLLEEVCNARGHKNKLDIFKRGFAKLRNDTGFKVQTNFEHFYQGIRLIIPEMDHGRKTYNMKEHKIGRTIIKMLNLGDGIDKKNLMNFNNISSNSSISIDFADIVHTTLRKYISKKQSTVTVSELNHDLDLIANRDSDTKLDEVMLKMFRKLSSLESKWIIRIMLKKLKLGVDNNKILNVFHPDAVEYYSSNTNLKKVCEILWNPKVKLNELNLNVFEPFQPMLSKRIDAESFKGAFLEDRTYFVETKFDGERFQLHMKDGQFKYFSRNGFDKTNEFGENYTSGTLTQNLKNVFSDNIKSIILDGEMMLWDKKKKKLGSKGMNLDVKKLKLNGGYYQPCFCVFDILLLNNKILTNTELRQRLKLLHETVTGNIEGTILLSEYKEVNCRQDIVNILNHSMDTEQEGIVVKDPASIYKYKDRKSGWFKIKMEYFEDNVTDLDVILMGGYYKANSNELKSFLVGVFSNDNDKRVLSFGKVSSGLDFGELEIVDKAFSEAGISRGELEKKSKGKLVFGKDIPDVWLEPETSLIFTIRATELIRCSDDSFRTPYTIRFPRIRKIRNNKSYEDCLSLNELLELCQKNKAVIKLNKRHLELEEVLTVKRKKQIKSINVDKEALKRTSNFLSSMKFFVISGNEGLSVGKIEELIERHGGTFSLHIEDGIQIVLVGEITSRVTELLKKENKFDVIKVQWLQRITNANHWLKYKQEEVLSIGTNYYNCLAEDVDMYGDSYTEETNADLLKTRLNYMAERDHLVNLNNSILFKADLPLFNMFIAYFDKYEIINNSHSKLIYNSFLDEIEFKYRLGTVADTLDPTVNLIIIGSRDEDRKVLLEEYARSMSCTSVLVIQNSQIYNEEEL